MSRSKSLDEFLANNRVSPETWDSSKSQWDALSAIAADHENNLVTLQQSASLVANIVQMFDRVHSVRWRIKDSDHLIEKIVRKRAEGEEKYVTIAVDNYHEVVTDLVGVRALHLFKDECFSVNAALLAKWVPTETPVAYVRDGDPETLIERFKAANFSVKNHPAAYRSVHYICAIQPTQRKVHFEVQVRTIFEEAWSEIDHRVRYPNFSDVPLVNYFLTAFNRMSGTADEMGSFVRDLAVTLRDQSDQFERASRERDQSITAMENALGELEKIKKTDQESREVIGTLRAEVDKLRVIRKEDSQTKHRDPWLEVPDGASLTRFFDQLISREKTVMLELEKSNDVLNSFQNEAQRHKNFFGKLP